MRLVPVHGNPDAEFILWDLLAERPRYAWISHGEMPTRSAHAKFVANHPFFHWYLIEVHGNYVGAIEVTDRNEIGVHVLQLHQRQGYGSKALKLFLGTHRPLPAIKAVRTDKWLANIAVGNDTAKAFFARAGFEQIQETWAL